MFVWTSSLPALPLRIRTKDETADRNEPAPTDSRPERPPQAPASSPARRD